MSSGHEPADQRTEPSGQAPGNQLANEASLYLRQHANDPVHWFPWGDAAFEQARSFQKPLLVSIGYSSCHWCHVMARESFQDPGVAALMNEKFVSVKVDREERPDVDAVYMAAVQALTGHGGWPLTVALTPEGKPFYGGTYFPPQDRHGAPSFSRVLNAIADAWQARRLQVEESAQELTQALQRLELSLAGGRVGQPSALLEQVTERLKAGEDPLNAGFGDAPKFPPHETLRLLLAHPVGQSLPMALRTLSAMALGGLRDQLGGGFARYSVDAAWRVPHFEMMLYDNAAMLRNYATAYARTGDPAMREVAYGVADWLVRELGFTPAGEPSPSLGREPQAELGFLSALDADQEGGEGAYYAWTEDEFRRVLEAQGEVRRGPVGPEGQSALPALAAAHFGVTTPGAFEGKNVLYQAVSPPELAQRFGLEKDEVRELLRKASEALSAGRSARPSPGVDDKALASWNGLALGALATAGRLMADERLIDLGRNNASYLRQRHWHEGRLWHMWWQGRRSVEGLLEDYAYVGLGLLDLYRATLDPYHLEWALELADQVADRFHDEAGGYFSTADDMRRLVVRPKGYVDAATPSENAAAAELVWWAARYRDDAQKLEAAQGALAGIEPAVVQAPQSFSSSLRALLLMQAPWREVVLVGPRRSQAMRQLLSRWRRYDDGSALLLQVSSAHDWQAALPLAEGRVAGRDTGTEGAEVAAYVCTNGVCSLPALEPGQFERHLAQAGFEEGFGPPLTEQQTNSDAD